ncbi:protein serine/threonine phosphatase PrpC [Gracilibacillus boraciitolerans JCM 21714]|uniref:protein-serine/threonine phosphatase n=1 Tax=Gracilibacillus boraciitolerans JCM 21714 TaxID=1298598 RepID=W4VEQ3_9BACI|nr:Stp1/IreP family PP2C-type Ser/Thr phosphatase [Gracilibacillus boraciitolerans]GAE91682.1 protein serine/threonine phosphatase PrpC [Gracilibacillus boraciitolerans JCM 21714]
MKYVYQSDKGKLRELNEDAVAVFCRQEAILAIVADGMGGHQAGDVASKMAIEYLEKYWLDLKVPFEREKLKKWLKDTVRKVNNDIYHKAKTNLDCVGGMGTTVVAAICTSEYLVIAHIGDSRAYMLNSTKWKQVTEDHSLVGELVRTGQLSEADAKVHPRRNVILKAVGTELDLDPDIYSTDWDEFTQLLVCTDGLSNKVSDQELHALIRDNNADDITQILIDLANDRGGEDNITLAVVEHHEKVGESQC